MICTYGNETKIRATFDYLLQVSTDRLEKARLRFQQAERQHAATKARYTDLVGRMAALGVTPGTIDAEIANLEAQLQGTV